MRNMFNTRKHLRRLLVAVLFVLCVCTFVDTNAQGYIYSSDGKIVESSAGYYVTEENIFNILSSSWEKGFEDEKFTSPSDLCLFKDKNGVETIYIVDSDCNKLFIFNSDLSYKTKVDQFKINPANFTAAELSKIKTRVDVLDSKGNITSVNSSNFWNAETMAKWNEIKDDENEIFNNPFYIQCYGLAGVFRAERPLRDENGKPLRDENNIALTEDVIYLCDSKNKQVLIVDSKTYEVLQVVFAPEGVDFASKYEPVKLVTDSTGRMYIVSVNVYEGILMMNYDGTFMTMVGVNYTTLSFWDALKRSQKTEEQLAQETTILPTSFNNLAIDKQGFLYTVSGSVTNADGTTSTDQMIKKINQTNKDVLKRNGYSKPIGDLITIKTGTNAGTSNFVAIAINDYGVYTVADSKGNRLFTYDQEGNLLYISGGSGSQVTDIKNAVAIAYQGDNILVLDKGNKCVMRFTPTDFARKINKAVYYEYLGDPNLAAEEWQKVINSNPAYELAYVGVGKKLYEEKRYQEAMASFELGADVKYFSRSYKMYRDEMIGIYFPYVGGAILALVGFKLVWKIVKKVKGKNPVSEDGEL